MKIVHVQIDPALLAALGEAEAQREVRDHLRRLHRHEPGVLHVATLRDRSLFNKPA